MSRRRNWEPPSNPDPLLPRLYYCDPDVKRDGLPNTLPLALTVTPPCTGLGTDSQGFPLHSLPPTGTPYRPVYSGKWLLSRLHKGVIIDLRECISLSQDGLKVRALLGTRRWSGRY